MDTRTTYGHTYYLWTHVLLMDTRTTYGHTYYLWTHVLLMKLSVNFMGFPKFRKLYQGFAVDCNTNIIFAVINRQHVLRHDGNVHPYDSRFSVSSLCCGGSPLNSAKASGL